MNRFGILKSLYRPLQPGKTRNICLSSKLAKDKLDAVLDAKLMSKRELIARQIENDVSVLVAFYSCTLIIFYTFY